MKFWGKIALGVVGAGVVAGLWFGDEHYTKKEEEQKALDAKVINFEPKNVRRITLTSPQGKYMFERPSETGDWKMLEPKDVRPDQDTLNNLLSAVQSLVLERELEGTEKVAEAARNGGPDAAQYGLDKPRIALELGLEGGKQMKLLVGVDVTVGAASGTAFNALSTYAVTSERKGMLVVGSGVVSATNKGFSDFRTKIAGIFAANDVKSFTVTKTGGTPFTLAKETKEGAAGGQWKITAPKELAADNNNTGLFLDKLARLRVDKVTEADAVNASNMAALGLETPAAVVEVKGADDKVIQTMKFGVTKESAYVTMPDGAVGSVDLSTYPDLVPELKHFRDRRVMREVPMADVTRIRTKSGRLFQKEGANWYSSTAGTAAAPAPVSDAKTGESSSPVASPATGPVAGAEKVSDKDANDFFSQWEFITADDIVDADAGQELAAFGLANPITRFTLEFADGKKEPLEILVGNRVPKNEKAVYVKRGDRPEVFTVETQWLDALTRMDGGQSPQAKK